MNTPRLLPIMLILPPLLALAAPAPAADVQEPDQPPTVVAQLAAINSSLHDLVETMRLQVGNQKTQLAMQRLDLARRDIAVRESERREAVSSRDGYGDQLQYLGMREDAVELEGRDASPDELELLLTDLRIQREAAERQIRRLDQRILDLDNALQRSREDLEIWEEIVADGF